MNNDPTSDLAYRFEYADGSAFEIYADGRAFLDLCERGKEEKFGKIDNRIPALIGTAAKPRQDRIDELLAKNAQLSEMAMSEALANSRLDEANEELRKQLVKYQDALKEVDGCFQAAYAEGLSERLAESDQGFCTLAELFLRRVVFAHHAAINALTDEQST